MATILESLKGVNAYPIPLRTLTGFAEVRGLTLTAEATQEVLRGAAYNLSLADLLLWLSLAPNISQGGQSYSFSDEQRADLRRRAYAALCAAARLSPRGGGAAPRRYTPLKNPG